MFKILFILLAPVFLFASPAWMFNLEHDKNYIIGYGMDNSLSKAKQNALTDITHSISVSVESNVDIFTKDDDGRASASSSVNSHTRSKAILSGVEFIKIEEKNGLWWVAARYDNSPLEIKFKKSLPSNLVDEKQNRYLKNTPLGMSLNAELSHKLNYTIVRKDNLWQLKYRDTLVPINQKNFYKLFSNQKTKSISIRANKKIYSQNDEMFFDIEHEQKGYISILYVEHNGKVGVLLANKASKKSFKFPDAKEEDVFTIANPYGGTIRELYVAIYSQAPLSLEQFEDVSDNLLDDSNYAFEKLISLLQEYNYSTYEIKIR